MGGRGSRSASAAGAVASVSQAPSPQATQQTVTVPLQQATTPNLSLGGSTDLATLQGMTPQQFAQFMTQQQQAANPMDAALYDSPVQRMIYEAGLNGKPEVVSESQFRKLSGQTLYRTVNSAYDSARDVNHPADQIARQTLMSAYNRIGGGIYGDGHYFDTTRSGSTSYGHTTGDVTKTAVMKAKLNANAKTISEGQLQRMLAREPKQLRDAMHVPNSRSPRYRSSDNNLSAYALYKGYNVIQVSGGYHVVIDRSALTFSSSITAK